MNGVELARTPGQYYALAYWLSAMLYIRLNPRRLHGHKLWLTEGLFLAGIGGFMVATDNIPKVWFLPCMAVTVSLIFLFLYCCLDLNPLNTGYYCVRTLILGELAASLEWQLFYYGLNRMHLPAGMGVTLAFLAVTYLPVFGLMYLLEKKYYENGQQFKINRREFFSTVCMGAAVYTVSNLSYAFRNTPFSSSFPAEIFIIRTLVDLGGVGILFAYHVMLHEVHIRLEMETLQNMLHMQYQNYKMSEESIALVNQKYHDLKHQIAILRSELDTGEKLVYLDRMEQEIKTYEAQNKTGNKVLDTILTGKSLQCQKEGISLTCVADGSALGFMHPMDISTLFGNALDNAIESVRKLPDTEKRLVHVSVARQKSFLRIRVENCYEGSLKFQGGIPATTKGDERYHGYGIKSIRNTVERYNGSVTISTTEGWFELRILIPEEQGKKMGQE